MTEHITITRKLAEDVLAILTDVVDVQRGVPPEIGWSVNDAIVGRELAEALGKDPAALVAPGQDGNFPHRFKPGAWEDFQQYRPVTKWWAEALTGLSGRFEISAEHHRGGFQLRIIHTGCPDHWTAVVDDLAALAELVQRAGEHGEVCR